MKVKEFILMQDIVRIDLESIPKPERVMKHKVPESLNHLNMGELITLQSIRTSIELIVIPARVLFGADESKVLKADAMEIIGLGVWVSKEIERINKLFAKTNIPPTAEEEQAGAGRMNFGPFGMVDYFARRMGIPDHEEVERVPWVRVYKCMDMDAQVSRYQRRLRNILSRKK